MTCVLLALPLLSIHSSSSVAFVVFTKFKSTIKCILQLLSEDVGCTMDLVCVETRFRNHTWLSQKLEQTCFLLVELLPYLVVDQIGLRSAESNGTALSAITSETFACFHDSKSDADTTVTTRSALSNGQASITPLPGPCNSSDITCYPPALSQSRSSVDVVPGPEANALMHAAPNGSANANAQAYAARDPNASASTNTPAYAAAPLPDLIVENYPPSSRATAPWGSIASRNAVIRPSDILATWVVFLSSFEPSSRKCNN